MDEPRNTPAFPTAIHGAGIGRVEYSGMSLRDWFAGQALVGFLAMLPHLTNVQTKDGEMVNEAAMATSAFAIADAMLTEREKA